MSKENKEEVINPFKNFSILDTNKRVEDESKPDPEDKTDNDDKSSKEETDAEREATRIADERLAEVAAKQAIALDKKKGKVSKEVVEENEDQEETKEVVEEDNKTSLKPFASYMKEKGILDYEDDEFEDTEEGLEKVVDKTIEKRVNDWKKSYPEETQKFLDYIENGGDPKQFINLYYNTATWEGFTIESEATQKHTIREGLRLAGYEDAEIEEELSVYEDLGKLEAKAKQFLPKLQKNEKDFKSGLIENQKKQAVQREKETKQYYDTLHKTWFEKEELNGFKLNKKAKEDIWDFIYKIDKKSGKTGLQESYENNIDAQFMYAYLAKNNFDLSKLEKIVKTKVTSEVRKSLSQYTDSRSRMSTGRTDREDKPDATQSSFAGFKNVKI